jgi:hypothetical protein
MIEEKRKKIYLGLESRDELGLEPQLLLLLLSPL